ncbi:hypothetical protein [Desulfopila aestuarii]|uniref:DUF2958 domain-containing protein n=1 Tax=Desulfopila aestuarii DSM 18488 TaxID=1121416 RepID=A0A1M7YI65_9BACT|nr:hypothetical protein [Desulfopila aestuarii]SHO52327.1 hypothetical protein SAMN02745220_04519 [Desulfopila aestuarii DSM 18488]
MINAPTREQLSLLPGLYETEHIPQEDKIVYLHFTIDQSHWWAIEWDGQDTFFGFVLLYGWSQYAEFGFFQLSKLREIKVVGIYEVVNDPFWIPQAVKDISMIRNTLHFQCMQQNRSVA